MREDRIDRGCPFEKYVPSWMERGAEFYMKMAFNEAIEGWGEGEVPVGAVIVMGGEIIGVGHNCVEGSKDPTAHAEVLAITAAAHRVGDWRLNGGVMYVTKEPCPMCAGASIMARLSKVVYGSGDEKMGCMGGAIELHKLEGLNHRVEVEGGVMGGECRELIQAFFRLRR